MNNIQQILFEDGISSVTLGFGYLCEAIEIYTPKRNLCREGGIYEEIAIKHGRKWNDIERCIRHAIKRSKSIRGKCHNKANKAYIAYCKSLVQGDSV